MVRAIPRYLVAHKCSYYDGDNYIQHKPNTVDGLSDLAAALRGDG
jgi:predicted SnoaL-like aldol condensation-catalyzing enzyme